MRSEKVWTTSWTMQMVGTVMNHDVLNQKTIPDNRYAKVLVENIMNVLDWLFHKWIFACAIFIGGTKKCFTLLQNYQKASTRVVGFHTKRNAKFAYFYATALYCIDICAGGWKINALLPKDTAFEVGQLWPYFYYCGFEIIRACFKKISWCSNVSAFLKFVIIYEILCICVINP